MNRTVSGPGVIISSVFFLGGMCLVLWLTAQYGLGVTHDTVAYMHAAKSLLAGEGLGFFGYNSPFIQWAPLYPAILAIFELTGIGMLAGAKMLGALCFGLTLGITSYFMYKRFDHKYLVFPAMAAIILCPWMLKVNIFAWTESLFILLIILSLFFIDAYAREGKFRSVVLAGAFSALCCLVRYTGTTLVMAVVFILIFCPGRPVKRMKAILLYGFISSVPIGAWLTRNLLLTGTLLGLRLPSPYPLGTNIMRVFAVLAGWFIPTSRHQNYLVDEIISPAGVLFTILFAFLMLCALATLAVILVKRRAHKDSPLSHTLIMLAFVVFTAVSLILSATNVLSEPIGDRYMLPVLAPLVIVFFGLLDYLAGQLKRGVMMYLVVISAIIWSFFPAASGAFLINETARQGPGGFTAPWYPDKPLTSLIPGESLDGTTLLISNRAATVYGITGVRTYSQPKKEGFDDYTLGAFERLVAGADQAVLVWFDNTAEANVYTLEEIGRLFNLELIAQNEMGGIYVIAPQ